MSEDIIWAAAVAFLHGEDPEDLDLRELADALGVAHEDVAALPDVVRPHTFKATKRVPGWCVICGGSPLFRPHLTREEETK
jgi:hypothetical protein